MENNELVIYKITKTHEDVAYNDKEIKVVSTHDDSVYNKTFAISVHELTEKLKHLPSNALVVISGDIDYSRTQHGEDSRTIEVIEVVKETVEEFNARKERIAKDLDARRESSQARTDKLNELKSRLSVDEIDFIKKNIYNL